ncbi:hypothetical protein Tco_0946556 [Tanacetum coccineum]
MAESTKRHEENSNIIKEIRASTDAFIRNEGALIKTLDIQIGQMSKVLQERGFKSLPSSTKTNPRDHVKSILTAKTNSTGIRRIGSGPYAISDSQISNIFSETVPLPRQLRDYYCDEWKEARELKILKTYSIRTTLYNNTLPQKEKDPGSCTLPCFIHIICFDKALVDLGDKGDHGGKELARTLIDIPIFVRNFSIISGFMIIDDMDETIGVVLSMPFCKKFVSCQKIMEKFAHRDKLQYGVSLGLGYGVLTPYTDLAVKKSTNW